MQKTFYAVVSQYDCDPKKHPPRADGNGAKGPLLLERYLDNESATSEDATKEIAQRFSHYGWIRVATVTIDIPE